MAGAITLLASVAVLATASKVDPRCVAPKPVPPPPVPPPPPLRPHEYQHGPKLLDAQHQVYVSYSLLEQESVWDIEITAGNVSGAGWLGVGWSTSGSMTNGDFVIGYRDCVRVVSMDTGSPPPNGEGGFAISKAGYYEDGQSNRTLRFQRPYKTSLPGHVSICVDYEPDCTPPNKYFWLVAAGTSTPTDCTSEFTTSNYHNEMVTKYAVTSHDDDAGARRTALQWDSPQAKRAAAATATATATTEPLDMKRHTHVSFTEAETISRPHPTLADVTVLSTTYVSNPIPLAPGQIAWTYPDVTQVPMPDGEFKILSLHNAEVVDCMNMSVPLSEVYNHHWVFNPSPERPNPACPNSGINFAFGVGAESRNSNTTMPTGYGYHVDAGTTWWANIHLLRTTDLVGGTGAAKECIECWYGPQKSCETDANGTFSCCYSDSTCATVANATTTPKVYYLKYVVDYTRDVSALKPVDTAILMAPSCSVEYNVISASSPNSQQGYPSEGPPGDEHLATYTWQPTRDMTFVRAIAHFHTGAINVSLWIDGDLVCTSMPVYGQEVGVAGNEKGYLVDLTECMGDYAPAPHGTREPVKVKAGSDVTVKGWYNVGPTDDRIAPTPAGPHLIVMSYMVIQYATETV